MDGQAAIHVAGWPLLLVFTDSRAWDTLVIRRINIAAKSQPELTHMWLAGRPLSPFGLWFDPTWSTCHKHSCSDTIFGRIPNVFVIS
jgi:hypothetical protein